MAEPVKPADIQRGLFPHLVCAGAAKAIDFYKAAFGAEEMMRMPGPDGRLMHAAITVNGHMVMMMDEMPEHGALGPRALKGTPVVIHFNVPDVDAQMARAEKAGAKVTMPAADMFWGDRYGQIEDPFGHRWSIATPQKRLSGEELKEAAKQAMCGAGQQ